MSSLSAIYSIRTVETVTALVDVWPLFTEAMVRLEPGEEERGERSYFQQIVNALGWEERKRKVWVLECDGVDVAFLVLIVTPNLHLEDCPWVFLTYTRKGYPKTMDLLVEQALQWSRSVGYKRAYFRNTSFGVKVADRYYRRYGATLNAVEYVKEL